MLDYLGYFGYLIEIINLFLTIGINKFVTNQRIKLF